MCIDIMGDPWVPMIRMGLDLGTKLNPSWVMGFLAGRFYVHRHGPGLGRQNLAGLCLMLSLCPMMASTDASPYGSHQLILL